MCTEIYLFVPQELGMRTKCKLLVFNLLTIGYVKENVVFCCTAFNAGQSKFGYYVTSEKRSDLAILDHSALADHQPLQRVGTADRFCFSLHHFVSETNPGLVTASEN